MNHSLRSRTTIALFTLGLMAFAGAAYAGKLYITWNGKTRVERCKDVSVDGFPGWMINPDTGNKICKDVCTELNLTSGVSCEYKSRVGGDVLKITGSAANVRSACDTLGVALPPLPPALLATLDQLQALTDETGREFVVDTIVDGTSVLEPAVGMDPVAYDAATNTLDAALEGEDGEAMGPPPQVKAVVYTTADGKKVKMECGGKNAGTSNGPPTCEEACDFVKFLGADKCVVVDGYATGIISGPTLDHDREPAGGDTGFAGPGDDDDAGHDFDDLLQPTTGPTFGGAE